MSKRMKELTLRQLDRKLDDIEFGENEPEEGWIRATRNALGMTADQLADRIGVSRPTVSEYEKREKKGTITLNSLKKAAEGLGCEFRYTFLPDKSLRELREKAARKAATKIVQQTSESMSLENQDVSKQEKQNQIDELTQELLDEWDNSIWDVQPG